MPLLIKSDPKFTWATVLTNPKYVRGAVVLAYSLYKVNTRYPLEILISDRITDTDILELRKASPLVNIRKINPFKPSPSAPQNYAFQNFLEAWTKLRCFEITDYDYVACLDCDMLVTDNFDHLLTGAKNQLSTWNGHLNPGDVHILAAHACICNPMKKSNYPKWWNPTNCAYSECNRVRDVVSAGKSEMSQTTRIIKEMDITTSYLPHQYFNTGFFIVTPNLDLASQLTDKVYNTHDLTSFHFAEQDFLSRIFQDHWAAVPLSANFLKTILFSHPHLYQPDQIHNLHYIMTKPWDIDLSDPSLVNDPFREMYQWWWQAYKAINNDRPESKFFLSSSPVAIPNF